MSFPSGRVGGLAARGLPPQRGARTSTVASLLAVAGVACLLLAMGQTAAAEPGTAQQQVQRLRHRVLGEDQPPSVEMSQMALHEAFLAADVDGALAALGDEPHSFTEVDADSSSGATDAAEFEQFVRQFKRAYATPVEKAARLANFIANKALVATLAAAAGGATEFTVFNEFGDKTQAEKLAFLGAKPPPRPAAFMEVASVAGSAAEPAPTQLLESGGQSAAAVGVSPFNWVNKATPVKNQANCGSCAHHSAIETYETRLALSGKGLAAYSPQWLLDCQPTNNQGCNGSNAPDHFKWMVQHTVPTLAQYPYKSKKGACRMANGKGPKLGGYEFAVPPTYSDSSHPSESAMLNEVKARGPTVIYIQASDAWFHYKSGIMGPSSCSSAYSKLNHAVSVFGYGVSNGVAYWLVRNHWASSWGEKGYIRLRYGSNTCGVTNFTPYPYLPGGARPVPPKPCSFSPPANGGAGNCPASMPHGSSCTATCTSGFRSSGATRCNNGAATSQTCSPAPCAIGAPAHGSQGNCPASLGSGASCQLACDSGYRLTGSATTCDHGRSSAQTCDAKLAGIL